MRYYYEIELAAGGLDATGEFFSIPDLAVPIAEGLLAHAGKSPDDPGRAVHVWCESETPGDRPLEMRISRVSVARGTVVWRQCAQLMAWGALANYGSLCDRADYTQFFLQIAGSSMQFYDPDEFPQVLSAFQLGWLAARGQADSSSWHPGEERRIGLNLAMSAVNEHASVIMGLGRGEELTEIWDEQDEAMDAAETQEQENAVWQATVIRITALRHQIEGGAAT